MDIEVMQKFCVSKVLQARSIISGFIDRARNIVVDGELSVEALVKSLETE